MTALLSLIFIPKRWKTFGEREAEFGMKKLYWMWPAISLANLL